MEKIERQYGRILRIAGYSGMILFILLNVLSHIITVNDVCYLIIMLISLVLFLPLCISEGYTLIKGMFN